MEAILEHMKDIWIPIQDDFDIRNFAIKIASPGYYLIYFRAKDSLELQKKIEGKVKFTEAVLNIKLLRSVISNFTDFDTMQFVFAPGLEPVWNLGRTAQLIGVRLSDGCKDL